MWRTEDHDGRVVPQPLHVLLGLEPDILYEGVISRVLVTTAEVRCERAFIEQKARMTSYLAASEHKVLPHEDTEL